MKEVKKGNRTYIVSSNEKYIIIKDDAMRLYVHDRADEPHYCLLSGESTTYEKRTYRSWEPKRRFLRDCLHTAEEIMHGEKLELGGEFSKVNTGNGVRKFGESHQENIAIATAMREKPNTGENARPGVGQAFVIVSTELNSTYPYHAAAVVAVDGDDFITLEVFASGIDANENDRNDPGRFAMYTATGPTSFHGVWSSNEIFEDTQPVTMVIEPS